MTRALAPPGAVLRTALICSIGLMLSSHCRAELHTIFFSTDEPSALLADDDLQDLRGRFSASSGILEIGVDLSSIWQAPDGSTLSASASIRANASEITAGTARIQTNAVAQPGASRTAGSTTESSIAPQRGTITGVNPVERVTGLGQAVQIAGDRNTVSNRLQLDVTRAPIPPSAIDGTTPSTPLPSTTAQASLADGSQAVATIGPGGLRVGINVMGAGSSEQRIGNSPDHSGIMQSVRVSSDAQAVSNSATIRLTMAPVTPATAINDNVLQVLRSMQGLRR